MARIVAVEVGVKVAGVVEAEAAREAVEEVVKTSLRVKTKVRAKRGRSTPDMGRPGTLTSLHSRPVDATGALASLLIFVRSQQPVHGRTYGFQGQINEIRASPMK